MKNVKLIRLVSGEEVIGSVVEGNDFITITDPIALYAPSEGKMGFMPYMPYTNAKEGVTISTVHVLFVLEPIDQLLNQYNEATGNIVVPKQGIIV